MADPITLTVALNKYLRLPGENAGDFIKQLKALTPKDKQDFRDMFNAEGITIKAEEAAA